MVWKIQIGRHQFAPKRVISKLKKTALHLRDYFSCLKKTLKDKRFSGNPASRIFRKIFEMKKIRQLFGVNLLAITLIAGITSPSISASPNTNENENLFINSQITQLTTNKSVRYPLESVRITQGYHYYHRAIDFAELAGSPVYPIMDGFIESISYQHFGYGNHIIINHGSGFKSLYAHLSKIAVKKGQKVDKITVIGLVGSTGQSTGPHLHLEVRDNDQPFNPLAILK